MVKKELKIFTLIIIMSLCLTMVSCVKKCKSVNKLVDESGVTVYGTFEKGSKLEVKKQSSESKQGKELWQSLNHTIVLKSLYLI